MPLSAGELNDLLAIEGSVSAEEILHLHRLAAEVSQGCIVEVGSFRGRSTAALAMGSLGGFQVPVYAVDPHDAFVGYYGGGSRRAGGAPFFAKMVWFLLAPVVRGG